MTNLLRFQAQTPTVDGSSPDRRRVLGHRIAALRQTPWMAPVCIQNAGDSPYACRILVELEGGHGLWLERERLRDEPAPETLESIRREEHQWRGEGTAVGRTLVAAASNADGVIHLVLEDGGLLSIADRPGGPLRYDKIDPASTAERGRLGELRDLWTGRPLVPGKAGD